MHGQPHIRFTKNEIHFYCSRSFESLNKITATVLVLVIGPIARSFELLATVDTSTLGVWDEMLFSLVDT